jgi:hypothetical protein
MRLVTVEWAEGAFAQDITVAGRRLRSDERWKKAQIEINTTAGEL